MYLILRFSLEHSNDPLSALSDGTHQKRSTLVFTDDVGLRANRGRRVGGGTGTVDGNIEE